MWRKGEQDRSTTWGTASLKWGLRTKYMFELNICVTSFGLSQGQKYLLMLTKVMTFKDSTSVGSFENIREVFFFALQKCQDQKALGICTQLKYVWGLCTM